MEQWRPVIGAEGFYEISSFGRCRRISGGKGAKQGQILRPFPQRLGYMQYNLHCGGRRRICLVHCLVADAFMGTRPTGLEVNHKNGDKADNRLENLEYVSRSENIRHAFRVLKTQVPRPENLGNPRRGEANGRSCLTANKALQIIAMSEQGVPHRKIAKEIGCGATTVWNVLSGRTWSHVTGVGALMERT